MKVNGSNQGIKSQVKENYLTKINLDRRSCHRQNGLFKYRYLSLLLTIYEYMCVHIYIFFLGISTIKTFFCGYSGLVLLVGLWKSEYNLFARYINIGYMQIKQHYRSHSFSIGEFLKCINLIVWKATWCMDNKNEE